MTSFDVTLTFEHPAWDERDGIIYREIYASGKAQAIAIARRQARDDGHLGSGKGRATFRADQINTVAL